MITDLDRGQTREKLFEKLLDAAPDALVIVNRDGVIVLVNSQTEIMFGYRRQEMLGQRVELLVPEALRGLHVEHRNKYFANPDPRPRPMGQNLNLAGRRKDGREFPVEISLSPLETEEGLLVTATIRDVTERDRMVKDLQLAEARFRNLVEAIPAVTFMAALGEGVETQLYVSPQIVNLLGFSQKEWTENPVLWYSQLHPEDRETWNREFAPTVAQGKDFRSVYRFIARDGRVVWVLGEAKVVRDENGRPLFLQGVAFDITGMKEAEEQLKTLNQQLEDRVKERTREAEMRAQELDQYAYRTSHDLQEPLRTIASFSKLLARRYHDQLDATAQDYISRTVNGAVRMQALISALLEYSRVGRKERPSAPTDMAAVFAAVCDNLEATIKDKSAQVTADPLPTVWANQLELELLLLNLIGNALKFHGDQPPRIHVGCRKQGNCWVFWVRDNGIGIDPKYANKIFEVFEKLHNRSQYEGTGIGLAICKKIVESHGGQIRVESSPGQGSTFSFTLQAEPITPVA
jgi:PAS domain S-box-containing protein